jgi:uncharacterized protein
MNARFADSFFYLALLNRNDSAHKRAIELAREIKGTIFTSSWVLIEVGDALAGPDQRNNFVKLVERLRADLQTSIVQPQEYYFNAGYRLYASRLDKGWTLTDCISFAIMKEHGIQAALTGDHHFEQAGFKILFA